MPVHAATSRPAQKAYLGTAIFAVVSVALFGLSTIAFLLFYNLYVPQIGVERTIHLQFGYVIHQNAPRSSRSMRRSRPWSLTRCNDVVCI